MNKDERSTACVLILDLISTSPRGLRRSEVVDLLVSDGYADEDIRLLINVMIIDCMIQGGPRLFRSRRLAMSKVMRALRAEPGSRAVDIVENTGLGMNQVTAFLKNAIDEKRATREMSGRYVYWPIKAGDVNSVRERREIRRRPRRARRTVVESIRESRLPMGPSPGAENSREKPVLAMAAAMSVSWDPSLAPEDIVNMARKRLRDLPDEKIAIALEAVRDR